MARSSVLPSLQPYNIAEFSKFRGLYVRGSVDKCPPDHLPDCLNVKFVDAEIETREGSVLYTNSGKQIVRMAVYKPNPPFSGTNSPRLIYMVNDSGTYRLIDEKYSGTPLLSSTGFSDFSLVNFFGRAYISFSTGKYGSAGINMYVYDGTGPTGIRVACGNGPSVAPSGAFAAGGVLQGGQYVVGYAWETASGFITQPSPLFTLYSAVPNVKLNLTGIAVGPTGTVARWVIATKSIELVDWTGNVNGYPFFFVTRIGDNTTTTYSMSFYDVSLSNSADYLFDLLTNILSGNQIFSYNGRLMLVGQAANPALVWASYPGSPERFSASSGFATVDPTEISGIRSGIEYRGSAYIFSPHQGYVAQDNGGEVSTWGITTFSRSIGTEGFGIGNVLDAKGAEATFFLVMDLSGIYLFNGVFQTPELTYKIKDYWSRINVTNFYMSQINIDPIQKRIYVTIPLDNSAYPNVMLMGDYRDGLDPMNIKWVPWTLPDNHMYSMAIYTDYQSGNPIIQTRFTSGTNILTLGGATNDNGTMISSYLELPPVRFCQGVSQFNKILVRATGNVTLAFTAYGQDKTISVNPASLVLASDTPGREYSQLFNLVSEQCRMKIATTNLNDYFKINRLDILGAGIFAERPR